MDDKNDQPNYDNVTRYALVIFAIVLLALVAAYAQKKMHLVEQATLPERQAATMTTEVLDKPVQVAQTMAAQQTADPLEPQIGKPVIQPILPEQHALATQTRTLPPRTTAQQLEEKTPDMKVEQRKIPGNKSVKMTDLLPEELKNSIKEAMLTDEQIRELTPEERKVYKKTQRDIIYTLRELAGLEAENKRLKGAIQDKAKTSEELNDEIEALRKMFE